MVEAQFPNQDLDARFALVRERPIDITLTGLEGMCDGAVFTVEHGVLQPSIDERAWIAELERRGGPELAARREAARVEAEARRQAHYAAWEARQQVEVSAEVMVQASVIRQTHYAQWEARHQSQGEVTTSGQQSPLPVGGEGLTVVAWPQGEVARPSTPLGMNGAGAHVASVEVTSSTQVDVSPLPARGEGAVVSSPEEWSTIEPAWSQPYAARLETVAVSTESQVATSASCSSCGQQQQVDAEVSVFLPALFNVMLNLGAAATHPQVHAAQPVSPPRR